VNVCTHRDKEGEQRICITSNTYGINNTSWQITDEINSWVKVISDRAKPRKSHIEQSHPFFWAKRNQWKCIAYGGNFDKIPRNRSGFEKLD
jgi:hypothetical protein